MVAWWGATNECYIDTQFNNKKPTIRIHAYLSEKNARAPRKITTYTQNYDCVHSVMLVRKDTHTRAHRHTYASIVAQTSWHALLIPTLLGFFTQKEGSLGHWQVVVTFT